jgi:hypothetical protein
MKKREYGSTPLTGRTRILAIITYGVMKRLLKPIETIVKTGENGWRDA